MISPSDHVVRAMLDDGSFRIVAARTTTTTGGVAAVQQVDGTTAEHLGNLLTGAVLFRETMAPGYRVQTILRATDGKSTLVADSHPSGDARGLVQLSGGRTSFDLNAPTQLQMMRSLPNGGIQQGVVDVPPTGRFSDAFMAYMEGSEQVTTVVGMVTRLDGTSVVASGGYLVQLLPEANADALRTMIEQLESLGSLENVLGTDFTPSDLVTRIVGDRPHTWLGQSEIRYHCWCSEVRVMSALATLDRQELEEMIADGNHIEISCDYCRKDYRIPLGQLRGLLEES